MDKLMNILQGPVVVNISKALVILLMGFLLAKLVTKFLNRTLSKSLSAQNLMILRRSVFYTILTLFFIAFLNQLGFDWKILLGTAGILTIALGFASQTSASNLISGIFLMVERPFVIDDLIEVGEAYGHVLSIDLLSTKIRTRDNILVRIPNETLMKSQFKNYTHFPIRRVDLKIGVAYKENIRKVISIIKSVVDKNPDCLDEPQPYILHEGFGDSSVDLLVGVWAKTENYWEVKTMLYRDIKEAFDKADIEIPFPHRSIYVGEKSKPFPVEITHN